MKKKPVAKAKKKVAVEASNAVLKKRFKYAMEIYEAQDDDTKDVIHNMEKTAQRMGGDETEAGAMMRRYVVIRLLVACAKWDIRIGRFKLPKKHCADCGVKV